MVIKLMWLFFLGWIAGIISCLGFGKWISNRTTKANYKLSVEDFEAMQRWIKDHDERTTDDP